MFKEGVYITGTGTDVGKTFISAGLTYLLKQRNINVCYYKPILSGAYRREDKLIPGDTQFVKQVSGLTEDMFKLTTYLFEEPIAPHLAARLNHQTIDEDKIIRTYEQLKLQHEFMIVEGAGGIAVPINERIMQFDLMQEIGLPIIIVADSGLGTINHTYLTQQQAKSCGLEIAGIIYNQYDDSNECHKDNITTIERLTGIQTLAKVPKLPTKDGVASIIMTQEVFNNIDIKWEAFLG